MARGTREKEGPLEDTNQGNKQNGMNSKEWGWTGKRREPGSTRDGSKILTKVTNKMVLTVRGWTEGWNPAVPGNTVAGIDYKIRVSVIGDITFDQTATGIQVTSKASSIFIQTDKAVYKPGDLELLSSSQCISKHVSSSNIVKLNLCPVKINSANICPVEISTVNIWPVEISTANICPVEISTANICPVEISTVNICPVEIKTREKNFKGFDVERVVLPKFEVNVVLPSFGLTTDRFFIVTINALYTFGKPVQGDAVLTIKRQWNTKDQIVKKLKINGKAAIRVLMSEIVPKVGTYIEVIANVTEAITGISANDTRNVIIYDIPEKLSFSSSMSSVFKPGLDYTIILRATQQDDSPLNPPLGFVNITVRYTVPGEKKTPQNGTPSGDQIMPILPFPQPFNRNTNVLWTRLEQIPESGIIVLSARFPKAAQSGTIQAFYRKSRASRFLSQAESPSRNYIQVEVKNNRKAQPGQELALVIKVTEMIRICNYKVFSKGSLITQGQLRMSNRKQLDQNLSITYAMIPQAKLMIYYVRRQNGEVVADAITFPIADIFNNKVSINFNTRRTKPGDEVQVELTADPNSLVNVLAVDKSVLLLKSGNDITTQTVLNELQGYSNSGFFAIFDGWDFWLPKPVDDRDAFSIFAGAGVYVLTDALLYQYIPQQRRTINVFPVGIPGPTGGFGGFQGGGGGLGGGSLAIPTRTRKNFPETWLWVNSTTGSDGTATIRTTAPDTITEWIASAFAVNPRSGLGVAATTANVINICLIVSVKLANNVNFTFVDANGNDFNPGPDGWTKSVFVKKNSVESVYFPLKPTALGKILLDGTARSTRGADAVQREFLIEAEGIKQNYNVPLLIDLRQKGRFTETIPLSFPPNLVEDSEFIKIQVIGDLLGVTLAGLEDLLQISYGCGEQNMIRFAPNVYVSTYLRTTNRLTNDVLNRVKNILEGGYQRELSYVHNDGSFSAFGNNDKSGTTWLTAFVIKSFSQAVSFTYIDLNVITKAVQWIIEQQETSGAFNEPGIVLHKEMQGGSVSSKRSLTAFVLIALLEARDNKQMPKEVQVNVTQAINNAVGFVANGAPASIANLYELAISFYALSLAKHPLTDAILAELEKKAKINGGEKYWTLPETEADKLKPWKSWRPPQTKVRAIDVEMTSYILLGYNLKEDTDNGIRILKWLGRQRNPRGGFISTQDTVIAIQALSGLGEKIYVQNFQMTVKIAGDTWPQGKTFDVNNKNALILQIEDPESSHTATCKHSYKTMNVSSSEEQKLGKTSQVFLLEYEVGRFRP
ncbi:CD109 [Mytilus coruscus]|uniref:CD109 n=1 Tax=Mytilus coruscus TaxID=42192 RepID=A0A6J8DEV5_MYTCO|nr:CD109 [Mytilus coruscus]